VPYDDLDDLFRIAGTPMDICGVEDCISIRRHSEIYSWVPQDAVIAEHGAARRPPKTI
jgi:hypothetical protein